MFGSSGKRTSVISEQHVETIIGKDTLFKGSIVLNGSIRIDGQVEGELTTAADVIVGETGNLKVQIKARNATIAGVVNGNMEVADKLELLATGKLYGDIKVGSLVIGEGAVFKGACEMRREADNRSKETKPNSAKS